MQNFQQNFDQIINSPTLIPMNVYSSQSHQKQNMVHSSTTSLEGTKALMYHYWEKNKKQSNEKINKSKLSKTVNNTKSQNFLPRIKHQNTDGRLVAYIRLKQKQKELYTPLIKQQDTQPQFHTSIKIIQFKLQNDDKQFLKFQKMYYKRWEEILSLFKGFQKFAQYYKLQQIIIKTKPLLELIDRVKKGLKLQPNHFLDCCENGQDISQMNDKKPGIRFYGKKGFIRAAIKIQSVIRGWIWKRKYKKILIQQKKARIIQQYYRCRLYYRSTKQKIIKNQLQKIQTFKKIQAEFVSNYRKKQIAEKIRYEVHIPSHNVSEWQKVSSQKYIQKQNSELCRIFKMANKNPLHETRIIYISPIVLPKQIVSYYNKLFQLGSSEEKINHRLTILTPNVNTKLPISMCPTQQLYYCQKTLKKIRRIINNHYAYIVPSTPSSDYILLCNQLNIPLYASNPQKLAYLSTKSGCKSFQQSLQDNKQQGFEMLPYSINIYNIQGLLNELTNLIFRYPQIKRWVLKIDNQVNSRGIAYIDISKIIEKSILNKIGSQTIQKTQQKNYRQQIYKNLENSLIINKQQRIIPLNKQVYSSQQIYLNYYFTRGGIIEASVNNFETQLENTCFTVNIQPDGQWKFVTSYYKITNKHKAIAAYFDSNIGKPSLSLYHIIQKLIKDGTYGFFTFQFISIADQTQQSNQSLNQINKLYYLNSIQCSLNEFSSSFYLKEFVSKDSNALFIPILEHPSLLELRIQTFFHLCRLQNISFDIQKKIGNIFLFLDGLQSGCVGIMTFNQTSKTNCFTHSAQVLDFLNSKLKTSSAKDIPKSFLSIKNAVNGYLNRNKKAKLSLKSSKKLIKNVTTNSSLRYIEDNRC